MKNGKTRMRLLDACKKTKMNLSMNKSASISIDCLMEDEDMDDSIDRDQFESITSELMDNLRILCADVKSQISNHGNKLHSVEVIGGGMRIPCMFSVVKEIFEMELSNTLNKEECISEGASVACAMESPCYTVASMKILD
jgi:heat shock protein 4